MEKFLLFVLTIFAAEISGCVSQGSVQPTCEQGSCYPATGDLLVGREDYLTASSTCGLERPERYCVVSYLEKDTKCFICDSRQPWRAGVTERSHRIENIVSSFKGRTNRWWQAEAGQEKVHIQLDLEAEFHVTHLIMTFKTFRPKAMLIERSSDFGKTWKVYRYFAQKCDVSFPHVIRRAVSSLSDVICEEKYSSETPSTAGEVIFRVLPPFIPIVDPYSQTVQDLLKVTNLRINFTALHTLGDTLLDTRHQVKEKYYYALYDVTVRGSCSCYGHASRCLPVSGFNRNEEVSRNMVHGMCECTHNTKGHNCERCEDFYHDRPWRPATPKQPHVCKRCNCNNHATECHFDAAQFQATGGVSGGVCDNCMHNTQGINCQECIRFYFQDPNKDIRDPGICQPCDCDTFGSINNGECEQITDEIARTVAGRCICKPFVTGDRCDRCKGGNWNLNRDNPLGCEPCSCYPAGTAPDLPCNQETGVCTCKRYVTGKGCDSCYPGFYDLSAANQYGCNSCGCDIGGSVKSSCDQVTGQCECRAHIRGRQCKQVDPGFFFANLDYYTFEAEYGRGKGNARVYIREPLPGSPSSWTGPGYMKVMEGDTVELSVSGLPFSTYYDIVIRYDSKMPEVFSDVRVSIIRPGQIDPTSVCSSFSFRDDLKSVPLPPGIQHQIVYPPSCLEKGIHYTVRLDFNTYIQRQKTPEATVLIDSIVLIPNVEYVPIYQGRGLPEYLKNEFLNNHCNVLQHPLHKSVLPEQCQRHTFSISAVLHNGAIDCDCDRTGSLILECNASGGQCACKPNVVGRRCDQCSPGTYGFGPNGCASCNCHEVGSRDKYCSVLTGQCTCTQNVGGQACDQCQAGFWGFPQCRQCQCNGFADTCDPLTGVCIRCRDFTAGSFCETCENGYYRPIQFGARSPCRPCMCPGGPGSSHQHADTCSFNNSTMEVHCNCRPGYTGRSCDSCIGNYFGAPNILGGHCQPCVCNGNINPDEPGSCDSRTGECLKCLFNTEGFACEHCRLGYYGDATKQNCARCVCYPLGVDAARGECDRTTGQCPCLPNVVGQTCDKCAFAHWNIASRAGCTRCCCDPAGSVSLECNQLTGHCECKPGRGGPKCMDCEDYFYGDPNYQCRACDCNPEGSKSLQCDRRTGQCPCVEGVAGFKCDHCARGTTGSLPNCVPCGECFDNWDKIISDLREQTCDIVKKASSLLVAGAEHAFDADFSNMQRDNHQVKDILSRANFSQADLKDVQNMLEIVRSSLLEKTNSLNGVDDNLQTISGQVRADRFKIQLLLTRAESLKALAKQLQMNATNITIQEVRGALDTVKKAEQKSREAMARINNASTSSSTTTRLKMDTERLVNAGLRNFQEKNQENGAELQQLDSDVMKLEDGLSEINKMVCGQPASPCSVLCGGAGCGRCGGDGCDGAVTTAQTALNFVQQAEEIVNEKSAQATETIIPTLQDVRQDSANALSDVQGAHGEAMKAMKQAQESRSELDSLLKKINAFFTDDNIASPDSVETIVREILATKISLTPEKIQEQTDRITRVMSTLKNIDRILNETAVNRAAAERLKQQADEASDSASAIQKSAQKVSDMMDRATQIQSVTDETIEKVRNSIQNVQNDINMIVEESTNANSTGSASQAVLEKLKEKLDQLTMRYSVLKANTLNRAQKVADEAGDLAEGVLDNAKDLLSNYSKTSQKLAHRYNQTQAVKGLADKLKTRADRILQFTESVKLQTKDIEINIAKNEQRMINVQEEIKKLTSRVEKYLEDIKYQAKVYETC